jgi:hypothetical protein
LMTAQQWSAENSKSLNPNSSTKMHVYTTHILTHHIPQTHPTSAHSHHASLSPSTYPTLQPSLPGQVL